MRMSSEKNSDDKSKSSPGCFILTILAFAAGIPFALQSESNIRTFGILPIVIGGIALAYFMA